MSDALLTARGLGCRMRGFELRDINLDLWRGAYHVLLGPTASGKSTLLKCLLGLRPVQEGRVELAGRDITHHPPEQRRMSYVPQNYALFPHLDVRGNILFGTRGGGKDGRPEDAMRLAGMLGLGDLLDRNVRTLSGGERQKTAVARALAVRPEVVLLDEPFSSVDVTARRTLWFDLRDTIRETGTTALHITHDLDEAFLLGDRVSVLIAGRLVQTGAADEVFARPATEDVAAFLNYRNTFEGPAERAGELTILRAGHLTFRVKGACEEPHLRICVRQQDIKILDEKAPLKPELADNVFEGEVTALYDFPEWCLMRFRCDRSPNPFDFEIRSPAYQRVRYGLAPGSRLRVAIWQPSIIVFPPCGPGFQSSPEAIQSSGALPEL